MQAGELKPILGALVLPPTGPLLLALLGLLWARRRRGGLTLAAFGIAATLVLACNGVAVWLSQTILPQVPPVQPQQLRAVQAIVVLGGGVEDLAPEYGSPQLEPPAYARLRYGAWLARRTGKPLAYAGGQGWTTVGSSQPAEARIAGQVLQQDYALELRWVEDRSRDTSENAQFTATLMRPDGIRRVAVVTDAWHMPRAVHYFQAAGFEVLPAPMGFPHLGSWVDDWIPSAEGLWTSRQVLREWIALQVARIG